MKERIAFVVVFAALIIGTPYGLAELQLSGEMDLIRLPRVVPPTVRIGTGERRPGTRFLRDSYCCTAPIESIWAQVWLQQDATSALMAENRQALATLEAELARLERNLKAIASYPSWREMQERNGYRLRLPDGTTYTPSLPQR